MSEERPARPCGNCNGRTFWHDEAWVCEICGYEWNSDHNPYYAAPGEEVSKPKALLVDVDGTLALNVTGRPWRGPGFEDRLHEDELNVPVRDFLVAAMQHRFMADTVVFMTGRAEAGRSATERWLWKHLMIPGPLFMRPEGNHRDDVVVKKELYEEHVQPNYDVVLALEDKPEIVDLWRNTFGLSCWAVRDYE